jgi:hypothetical protein
MSTWPSFIISLRKKGPSFIMKDILKDTGEATESQTVKRGEPERGRSGGPRISPQMGGALRTHLLTSPMANFICKCLNLSKVSTHCPKPHGKFQFIIPEFPRRIHRNPYILH